jgi:hypothetical protein
MAVNLAVTNSFKQDLLIGGRHSFAASGGSTFNVALIRASETGTYGAATTNYSDLTGNSDEASVGGGGGGYTAGGSALTRVDPTIDTGVAITDFDNVVWTLTGGSPPTLASNGCLIYNTSSSNRAVSVHPFSGDPSASGTGATFTIQWPAPAAATAVIRIA